MPMLLETADCLLLSTHHKKTESVWRNDSCYKFIYSLKGSMQYQSRRNDFSLNENEFMVFNPHDEHKQIAVDDHKFLIELDAAFLNEAVASVSLIHDDFFLHNTFKKVHSLRNGFNLFSNTYNWKNRM